MNEPPQFTDEDISATSITSQYVVLGDHLAVLDRNLLRDDYYHHGISIGGTSVVHLTGEAKSNAKVEITGISEFMQKRPLFRINYPKNKRKSPQDTADTAKQIHSDQNWGNYKVLGNNCEHFATFCVTGRKESAQAIQFIKKCLKIIVENVGSPIQKPLLS